MLELAALSPLAGPQPALLQTDGLRMTESPLRVFGVGVVRGQSAEAVEQGLGAALPARPGIAQALPEGWIVCTEPNAWRIYYTPERHRALIPLFSAIPVTAALFTDLSSWTCTLELAGAEARRAIGSGCPLDLHPREFGTGRAAGSRLNDIPIHIVKISDSPSFLLSCDRAYARTAWDWLPLAASSAGAAGRD